MFTKNTKLTIGVIVVAVLVAASTALVFLPASLRFGGGLVEFRIEKGEGLNQIAEGLARQGLLKSQLVFKVYATLLGQNRNLKAGRYELSYAMSVSDLVQAFAAGRYQSEDITVTIPEGSNINDIDRILAQAGLTQRGDFLDEPTLRMWEGYLFPDTYNFLPASRSAEYGGGILETFGNNFKKKTAPLFSGFSMTQDIDPFVTIASILEKEVQTPQDMALVAGIIQNRLTRGMPLQIDATVAYGECFKKMEIGTPCEVKDVNLIEAIKRDGPYNTYTRKGLPPGPISNPGLNALNAALHPTAGDYLYYLTDKAGAVHYARTAAEHQTNRTKYLNK